MRQRCRRVSSPSRGKVGGGAPRTHSRTSPRPCRRAWRRTSRRHRPRGRASRPGSAGRPRYLPGRSQGRSILEPQGAWVRLVQGSLSIGRVKVCVNMNGSCPPDRPRLARPSQCPRWLAPSLPADQPPPRPVAARPGCEPVNFGNAAAASPGCWASCSTPSGPYPRPDKEILGGHRSARGVQCGRSAVGGLLGGSSPGGAVRDAGGRNAPPRHQRHQGS